MALATIIISPVSCPVLSLKIFGRFFFGYFSGETGTDLPTQRSAFNVQRSAIDNRCIIKFKQIKLPVQQRKQKSSCTLGPPADRSSGWRKWNNLLGPRSIHPAIHRSIRPRSTYTHGARRGCCRSKKQVQSGPVQEMYSCTR